MDLEAGKQAASLLRNKGEENLSPNLRTDKGYNVGRVNNYHYKTQVKYLDLFHTLLEAAWWKCAVGMVILYIVATLVFAGFWYIIGNPHGEDPCALGFEDFTDAYYFSLITITTIGYGANTVRTLHSLYATTLSPSRTHYSPCSDPSAHPPCQHAPNAHCSALLLCSTLLWRHRCSTTPVLA
jgi:hypothetical protein